MQNYQHGSVVLLALPFSDTTTFKLRPALNIAIFQRCDRTTRKNKNAIALQEKHQNRLLPYHPKPTAESF